MGKKDSLYHMAIDDDTVDVPKFERWIQKDKKAFLYRYHPSRDNDTLLHILCRRQQTQYMIQTLSKCVYPKDQKRYKIDINARNKKGETPLLVACWTTCKNVEMLLKVGADPNIPSYEGATPLTQAAIKNDVMMIVLLLKYKADAKAFDTVTKRTAAHWFACGDADKKTKLLVFDMLQKVGTDLTLLDWEGQTAMEIVEILHRNEK
jgi:hypothetical protein